MKNKLNAKALGYSGAIVSAICMLFLGVFGGMGVYSGMARMMVQWHMFFSFSFFGIIFGIIEAGIIGFIFGYLVAYFYNKFI